MKKYIPQVFILLVVLYLLFLIRPALLGQLTGTFQPHTVPPEYTKLEKFLDSQKQFSRTLWVPTTQRFGFYSSTHPAISAEDLFHISSVSGVIAELKKQKTKNMLQEAGVKYVIVPYDSEGEIFLNDRKYDNAEYLSTINSVGKITYLTPIPGFGKIAVFEVPSPNDHFWLQGGGSVSSTFINPTKYTVDVENVKKGERLVFSEGYDKYWTAILPNTQITSKLYNNLFNSFVLPQNGSYSLTIFYTPQKWVDMGLWISGLTALAIGIYFISYFMYRKKYA